MWASLAAEDDGVQREGHSAAALDRDRLAGMT